MDERTQAADGNDCIIAHFNIPQTIRTSFTSLCRAAGMGWGEGPFLMLADETKQTESSCYICVYYVNFFKGFL